MQLGDLENQGRMFSWLCVSHADIASEIQNLKVVPRMGLMEEGMPLKPLFLQEEE